MVLSAVVEHLLKRHSSPVNLASAPKGSKNTIQVSYVICLQPIFLYPGVCQRPTIDYLQLFILNELSQWITIQYNLCLDMQHEEGLLMTSMSTVKHVLIPEKWYHITSHNLRLRCVPSIVNFKN